MCVLKKRIFFILMVFLVFSPILCLARDRGGNRRDYQFSSWKKLEESVLSEMRKTQKLKQEVRNLTNEYETAVDTYHSTEKGGLLGLFDPKKKARKAMDACHEKLKKSKQQLESSEEQIKDFLASTPPGNRIRNLVKFKANTEAIELRNALLSVQGIVESLGMILSTDKSDSITAVEYYQNYLEMLGYLQTMHRGFIDRAEGQYYEYLKNLWGEWLKHAADIKKEVAKISGSETRAMLYKKLDDISRVVAQMPDIVRGLATMKNWANNNLTKIREKKTAVSFLHDHAILSQNTEKVVSDIDTAFLTLKFDDPPLVEFEIDIEKIELKNVPPRAQKG